MYSTTAHFAVLFAVIGLAFGQSQNITYEDCGSKAQILLAEMDPCDSDPCVLKRKGTSFIRYSMISDDTSRGYRDFG
ncbi:hypothetical protein HPB50_029350 [Hyalomma asiaticum]|nr:hypothetical protein HPB50_029350 [Hyalomma asiaticum]